MNEFLECLDEYISLDKSKALGYATINSQVITSIDPIIDHSLYNHVLSFLPISLSVLEEISTINNQNINNIYVKGTIIKQTKDFETTIQFINDTNKYTIDKSIISIYPIPHHLTTVPIVGKHYLVSKSNPEHDDVFLYCL